MSQSLLPTSSQEADMPVRAVPRRFTIAEYYRMAEAGILHEDDRVELIEGEVVEMAPIGSRHAACVNHLNRLLYSHGVMELDISVQNPIHLGDNTEPQPDLVIARHKDNSYADAHPGPEDILLLVEVCDTSAGYDRGVKVPLYARAGVPETWLVLLEEGLIEVYRNPKEGVYQDLHRALPGESLAVPGMAGLELATDAILLTT